MKITTRTEYGIRVLVTLARGERGAEDRCQSLSEIARREKLPACLSRADHRGPSTRRSGHRDPRPERRISPGKTGRCRSEWPRSSGRSRDRSSRCRAPAWMTSSTAIGHSRAASTRSSSASTSRCRARWPPRTSPRSAAGAGGPPYPQHIRRRRQAPRQRASPSRKQGTHDRRTRHRRARGEHRRQEDPQGSRPHRSAGRGPRAHGPQWLGQDEPGLQLDGPPRLRGRRRHDDLGGPRPPGRADAARDDPRQARAPWPLPRLPVSERDPRA